MATGSRTLKLSILGDVSDLNKSLKTAEADVSGFGDKISKFGAIAAAGFLAAGAAATKFAIDAVKNAAADEAAQRTLQKTIENTTAATADQIAGVEKWITTTSLAKGVTDDVLRPAFARLTRSTKDVEESQKLLNLALDISSATGKPLEAVANSLGKAYDGNTNALGKLGLGIDQNILKSKDFDAVYTTLRGTFKGFAEQEANTFEGKLNRLKIAFDEGKETVGSYIIDAITPLVTLTVNKLIPALQNIAEKIGKAVQPAFENIQKFIQNFVIPIWGALKDAFDTVSDSFIDNKDKLEPLLTLFKDLWDFVYKYIVPVFKVTLVTAIQAAGEAIGFVLDLISPIISRITDGIRTTVNLAIDGINALIKAYNFANGIWGGADVALVNKLGENAVSATTSQFSRSSSKINNDFITGGTTGVGGSGGSTSGAGAAGSAAGAAVAAAASSALPSNIKYPSAPNLTPSEALFSTLTGTAGNFSSAKVSPFLAQSPTINLTVNGAIDPIGTARTIYTALGMEATTSGTFNNLGGSRVVAQ